MNLTRKQKDRIIKVLKQAKPLVKQGYTVCEAIDHIPLRYEDHFIAKDYIKRLLFPLSHSFVTTWLYETHGIYLDDDQAVKYRTQWVDHMIKELRK